MNKKISVIGLGKLGLCFALNLEKKGFQITGIDIDENYINSINYKTLKSPEKDVELLLSRCENLYASNNLELALENDIIFVVVATPSLPNGKYNHEQIDILVSKLKKIGKQQKRKDLVICCTTMPTYCDKIQEELDSYNYKISYNPEFIAQGSIIKDQLYPDMVLIGQADEISGNLIENVYKNLVENQPVFCKMSRTEAEITKISINCFVTTKISFANMIGDICNKLEISHFNVLNAIGCDSRINNKYLKWGYGFGGPCFPRDNRALGIFAEEINIDPLIPKASDQYNNIHLNYQIEDFIRKNEKQTIEIDGVSYKKDSIIIEESQQLKFAVELAKKGLKIVIKDKIEVITQVKKIYGDLFEYTSN
jgi:UDPglucose 6-dehydrogenase